MRRLDAQRWKALKPDTSLRNYERVFQDLTSRKDVRLLELGVFRGGSLAMWEDYFPHGIIVGLDIRPSVLTLGSERIKVYCGRQSDTALLSRIARETAPDGFDVIIDDCSHIGAWSRISFWHLFDHHLKPGGVYVIEDWRTGFLGGWPDGKPLKRTFRRRHSLARTLLQRGLEHVMSRGAAGEAAATNPRWKRLASLVFFRQTFPSHSHGMVGLVKQLIDEFGLVGSPLKVPTWFDRMDIHPGHVFIFKKQQLDS